MRKVVQVQVVGGGEVLAVCGDGTLWRAKIGELDKPGQPWHAVPAPPDGAPFPSARPVKRGPNQFGRGTPRDLRAPGAGAGAPPTDVVSQGNPDIKP